jgi:hypothetical protein
MGQLGTASGFISASAPKLSNLKLVDKTKPTHEIHHMRDGCVVLYKRERSGVWQVRFKLFDQRWHRFTTKYKDLTFAKRVAGDIYDRSKFKEEMGIPLRTRRFGAVAEECQKLLEQEIAQGLLMLEKHYSKLTATMAADKLA